MRRWMVDRFVLALLVGVGVIGCDVDPPESDGDAAGEDVRERLDDTGPSIDTDEAPGDTVATETGTEDTAGVGEDTGDDASCDGRVCDKCVACKFKESADRSCDMDEERPSRCEADPVPYDDWGPGSVLTSLELTSDAAQQCCFNIDGSKNGSPDNQLGEVAAALPFDVDREIKERLTTGGFATLMEHQGLDSLEGSQTFDSNIYVGYFANADSSNYLRNVASDCDLAREDCAVEASSGKSFLVSPESFDAGTHPQVQFHPAELTSGQLAGGPSRIVLNFGVRGVGAIVLKIYGATIEADVDTLASDLEGDGVVVDNGKLGGYVLLADVVTLLNNLLAPCDCLDNPERAIRYPGTSEEGDPDLFPDDCSGGNCELTCADMVRQKADNCGAGSGLICEDTDRICSTVGGLVDLADLDSDNDGQLDALSIGAIFEMKGADIAGVADYINVPDQALGDDGTVTVDRVFANEPGWVAVYGNPSLSPDTVLGSTRVEPGNHTDVGIAVSGVSETTGVRAVLHRDDGPQSGTFEAGGDTKVQRYPEMSGYVSDGAEIRIP